MSARASASICRPAAAWWVTSRQPASPSPTVPRSRATSTWRCERMAAASVIGPGTVVRGNVRGEGSLEIQGRVEGDVTVSGDVVIGDAAVVRGNVTGGELSVAGTVQGD